MNKITCLIVDDEPPALDLLESYVLRTPFLELAGRCASAFEAMEKLQHSSVDLLFLDVQMPDLSGIAFSKTLQNGPRVIFTTAFAQYALDSYKVDALDYLLKPFNYEEFLRAAQKAKTWFEMAKASKEGKADQEDYIFVKSEYKLLKIKLSEVLYFEGWKDYVKIFTTGQDRPIMSLMSLKSLEEKLPDHRFMRVHRSFIVQLDQVKMVERGRILFDTVAIPVADQFREKFQAFLQDRSFQ